METVRKICLDACSVINLVNCNNFRSVLSLENTTFFMGPSVYDEVIKVPEQKEIINTLISDGLIEIYEGEINVELVDSFFETYQLGDGETETVAICNQNGYSMCCDDRLARAMAETIIGEEKTMGSLRLLKFAVQAGTILCTDAFIAYQVMITEGGFLPKNINNHFFCSS